MNMMPYVFVAHMHGACAYTQIFKRQRERQTTILSLVARVVAPCAFLVLKYVTDVVPNLQTVVWFGLSESFVHNLALSFAQPLLIVVCRSREGQGGVGGSLTRLCTKRKLFNYFINKRKQMK